MKELLIISALFMVSGLFAKTKVETKNAKLRYSMILPSREIKKRSDYLKKK